MKNERIREIIEITFFSLIVISITMFMYLFYDSTFWILLIGILCLSINISRFWFQKKIDEIINFIIKTRYLIALVSFLFCLCFKLHGSSIGIFSEVFTDGNAIETAIIGEPRWTRSDEYNVQLPYYFSQYYNDYDLTSYQMSISGQDMIISYNAPVNDISMLAKPFTIGYILFGNEIGLSWYWCSKLILCILVMYEMSYIVTKGNRKMSLLGSLLIVFSPAMQWWFSPHIYDVFFWSMTLFVLGYYFFTAKNWWSKWGITILSALSLVGFMFALFPSLQISLGLIALFILICVLVRDKDSITFQRKDFLRIITVVMITGGMLTRYLLTSYHQIDLLYNTVYPGNRLVLGGGYKLSEFFSDYVNFISPFKNVNFENNPERSRFYHLGILFLLYFPYIAYRYKKDKDKEYNFGIGMFLVIAMTIEILFMTIGFPNWLAKITLFSYINRMNIVYSFTALLFTLWNFSILHKNQSLRNLKIAVPIIVIFGILNYYSICDYNFDYIRTITTISWAPQVFYIGAILLFMLIGLFAFMNQYKLATYVLVGITVVSTFSINPIVSGISDVTNHDVYKIVQEVIETDDSYWLALGGVVEQNYLIASGAKCLNAVNFYPDYDKWDRIDEDRENSDFYNRYIHIQLELTDNNSSYELIKPDHLLVNININNIKAWNVKYILTSVDISDYLEAENTDYEVIYDGVIDNHYIYKLIY